MTKQQLMETCDQQNPRIWNWTVVWKKLHPFNVIIISKHKFTPTKYDVLQDTIEMKAFKHIVSFKEKILKLSTWPQF